jgi:hypothetical protein
MGSITKRATVSAGRAISIASPTIATTSGSVTPTVRSRATEQMTDRADSLLQELCLQTNEFVVVEIPGILEGNQTLKLIDNFGPRRRSIGAA